MGLEVGQTFLHAKKQLLLQIRNFSSSPGKLTTRHIKVKLPEASFYYKRPPKQCCSNKSVNFTSIKQRQGVMATSHNVIQFVLCF